MGSLLLEVILREERHMQAMQVVIVLQKRQRAKKKDWKNQ